MAQTIIIVDKNTAIKLAVPVCTTGVLDDISAFRKIRNLIPYVLILIYIRDINREHYYIVISVTMQTKKNLA